MMSLGLLIACGAVALAASPSNEGDVENSAKHALDAATVSAFDGSMTYIQTGPTLDDGQKGPRVLGKIDLRPKAPPPRPASPEATTTHLTTTLSGTFGLSESWGFWSA